MSVGEWTFADMNGNFVGMWYLGPQSGLTENTPPGLLAVAGRHDHTACRLDVSSGRVVACRPAPPSDPSQVWTWDDEVGDYVGTPTEAALAAAARRRRDALLVASDAARLRSLDRPGEEVAGLIAFREALRALPQQPGFPHAIDWPAVPPGVTSPFV